MLVENGQRFVAFFDLLGFSSWLEADGSRKVFTYVRGFLNLMIRASLPGSIVHPDMSVTVNSNSIACINFSDSIVFYTRDDSEECLETILSVAGEFMNVVITGPSRMIRGAIAYGDFFADPTANAYVGKALVDAYRLEERQDWLSCSIDNSVVQLPFFELLRKNRPNFIVKALVPLRNSSDYPFCLNWADPNTFRNISFGAEHGLAECEQRAIKAIRNDPNELNKLVRRVANTRGFLRHYNGS